jgi:hypothetical protein
VEGESGSKFIFGMGPSNWSMKKYGLRFLSREMHWSVLRIGRYNSPTGGFRDFSTPPLDQAVRQLGLSARAYHRIVKVSRTIADLEADDNIRSIHLLEAIQYGPWTGDSFEQVTPGDGIMPFGQPEFSHKHLRIVETIYEKSNGQGVLTVVCLTGAKWLLTTNENSLKL